MGKIIETKINRFNKGMTPDARSGDNSECQLCKHFDNYTYRTKLVPYKDSEAGMSAESMAIYQAQNFLQYGVNMYGLGRVGSGHEHAQILLNNNLAIPSWSTPTDGADSAGTTGYDLFIEYNGSIYGSLPSASAGRIWDYNIGTPAFTATTGGGGINHTNITQGLIHSKNNILFVGMDNLVYKKDGANNFALGLTCPTGFVISNLCEWGNYLAISGVLANGKAKVFFWDMSATSWNDTIDWSENVVYSSSGSGNHTFIIENLDGYLYGISIEGTLNPKMVIKKWYNGFVGLPKEIYIAAGGTNNIYGKKKYNNRIYFGLNASSVGTNDYDYTGIWSCGNNGEGGISLNFDRVANNNTAVDRILGFHIQGDYFYISYLTGSTYSLSKTNDQVSYTAQSVYEIQKQNGGDSSLKKDLIGVSVMTEYLPANGQVVLKYKTDEDTSWSDAIFTEGTNNSISYSAVNSLPKDYKEIWFQIISTGGAEITGLSFMEEITGKRVYG